MRPPHPGRIKRMKRSLQEIEDYYVNKGLKGQKLKEALENDKDYLLILGKRKKQLKSNFRVREKDEKEYVLSTNSDYEILEKIYQLEKEKLSEKDKKLARLIRAQLRPDWRTPLLRELNQLLKRYK